MNKKILIPLIGLVLLISLLIWQHPSYSENVPYPNPDTCEKAYLNEMHSMRQTWQSNIEILTSQEKPASEMVDGAFESTRTLHCWMDYLCRAVRYSGTVKPENAPSSLTGKQVGRVPGCVPAEDITQLRYIEQCRTDAEQAAETKTENISGNYDQCTRYTDLYFNAVNKDGASATTLESRQTLDSIGDTSPVFIAMEGQLKKTHAAQRARAVETKLAEIVNKMHGMEAQAQQLQIFLSKLYDLLPCYAIKCN